MASETGRKGKWAVAGGVAAGALLGLMALSLAAPHLRPASPSRLADPAVTSPPDNGPSVSADGGASPATAGGEAPAPPGAGSGSAAPSPAGAPGASAPDMAGLRTLLEEEATGIRGDVAVHVRLDGGGEAGINENAPMPAASVIKLPLMAVLEEAWTGGLRKRSETDRAHMERMITHSDNPAADALLKSLGMERANAWLESHGYEATRFKHTMLGPRPQGHNTVSAAEMTRMLLEIARGELVSPEASAEMRRVLLAQTRRTRIPAGLPAGTTVGNKTGTLNGIVNDVALVETPGGVRYAVAVLISDTGPDVPTSKAVAALSRKIHDYVTKEVRISRPGAPHG